MKNLKPTLKHGGSIMIWGCISAAGVGEMTRIEGIMKKEDYLHILKQHLHKSAEKLGIRDTFKFYQDNDPKRKFHIVKSWLLYKCPKVLETPPQSHDLNPIENLWAQLKSRTWKTLSKSKVELEEKIKKEWGKITSEDINKYISNMPQRLGEVIRRRWYPAGY